MSRPRIPNDPVPVVRIALREGQVWVDAPSGVLTPELRAALAAQKEMLLALLARDDEATSAPTPAPWAGQRVRLEALPAFLARWGLRAVGGDPDLLGEPWAPKLYLVEA